MDLKYKIIKSGKQYVEYSKKLLKLRSAPVRGKSLQEEIDLLVVLIDRWNNNGNNSQNNSFDDPVALIRFLMNEHNLRAKDLVEILGVSKGLVSEILNYKKGLSKENLQVLARYFKVEVSVRYTYKARTWT